MKVIGLTGGIASGKTTVGRMFSRLGVPVFNVDEAVHELYRSHDFAVRLSQTLGVEVHDCHGIDRTLLSLHVSKQHADLAVVEAMVHPKVREKQQQFKKHHIRIGTSIILVDIPLLFESQSKRFYSKTIVVSAPLWLRQQRALRRSGMGIESFNRMVARQWPDHRKCREADAVIYNGLNKAYTFMQVHKLWKSWQI